MIFDEESFVDLYEVLEVSPRADASTIRKRISVLYLEARDNIDHRNHRKRFYFRELYEIHLPNARTVLLDLEKRAEYDLQLQAYLAENKNSSTQKSADSNRPANSNRPAVPASPKQNIADDFAEFGDVETVTPSPSIAPNFLQERKVLEQRRDVKRRELIKHEIIASGFKWGLAGGLAVLLCGVLLILLLNSQWPGGVLAATGISLMAFLSICAVSIIALAAFSARQTMRWARRRTVGYLSTLPYDELLRQCAG